MFHSEFYISDSCFACYGIFKDIMQFKQLNCISLFVYFCIVMYLYIIFVSSLTGRSLKRPLTGATIFRDKKFFAKHLSSTLSFINLLIQQNEKNTG